MTKRGYYRHKLTGKVCEAENSGDGTYLVLFPGCLEDFQPASFFEEQFERVKILGAAEMRTGDSRDLQREVFDKVSDLIRYYMAEHELSTIEAVGALQLAASGLCWVHHEVCGAVPPMYAEERKAAGNACNCSIE